MDGRNRETLKRHYAPPGRRGIALIDVIIGAMMLALGLAVIISLSSRSLAWQTTGEHRMVAAWLADELLTMVLVEGPEEFPHLYDMDGEFYEPFKGYFYSMDIRDNGPGTAFSVLATISWEGARGADQIQLEAAIAARRGDPDQPREPRERVDRETRHYERIFGQYEEDRAESAPRRPTNPGGSGRAVGGRGGAADNNRGGRR